MNELDLKEIIFYLAERIKDLEVRTKTPELDFIKRSDEYTPFSMF